MTVLEVIRSRRSIRDFQDRPVPADAVDALIEAIRWAPSAGNLQSRKFYFVFNPETRKQLSRAALNQGFIAAAPLVVVACLDRSIASRYGDRGVDLYAIEDAAAAVMNLMLAAHEQGLGSVWVGAFNEREVTRVMSLPAVLRPVAIIPVGVPAQIPKPPSRVAREEAVMIVE